MVNRKAINITYDVYNQLEKSKSDSSDRLAHVLERLFNEYEKELMEYE